MSAQPATLPFAQPALRLLAAAPHRLMFFIGATNVLLSMAWWTAWLIDARWNVFDTPQPAVPAGWMHAIVMQYHVLPSFMFGFLLTVFPRWMNQIPLTRAHYVPVGIGMFGGQALTLVGLFAGMQFLIAGAWVTAAGWLFGTTLLIKRVCMDEGKTWHAVSCAFALSFGLLGLLLYTTYLHQQDPRLMFVAIKIGTLALLLPIYFTVCHRMIPFFASGVIRDYRIYRPMWTLLAVWLLAATQLWLELRHAYTSVWIAALPLCAITTWMIYKWLPKEGLPDHRNTGISAGARGPIAIRAATKLDSHADSSGPHSGIPVVRYSSSLPALLNVLFIGFAWLPVTFALYTIQSLWFATTGEFVLGRAPAHALFIGFFGSLLVAMVTRVTQGHSGRPLVLGNVAAVAFVAIQVVAVTRVVAELVPNALVWQIAAASGWLLAFLPWIIRSTWIYVTPRTDGKEG